MGTEAEAVLITGVYGVGKTTLVEEMAHRLELARIPYAAIDLDWLSWFYAHDEATEQRVRLANLTDVAGRYYDNGVRRFLLAHSVPDESAARDIREALGVPMRVVGLQVSAEEVRARLGSVPTGGRQDDLRVALDWLADGRGTGFEDYVIDAERPVPDLADDVLELLGWL
jgi:hypothetical protein